MVIGIRALPESGLVIILSRELPPPLLASLQVEQVMVVWSPDQLQATVKETTAILKLNAKPRNISSRLARAFHERTKGWIAGLILLGMQGRVETAVKNDVTEETNPLLFSYLANEVLQSLPQVRKELLLQTALFQNFTGMMACHLTGIKEAGRELGELRRLGYFIEARSGDEPIYQYHPLLREFLLEHGRRLWSIHERSDLRRQAVEILKQVGWEEDALEMVFDVGPFEESVHLLLTLAPKFHAQFRIQTLERYLQRLPKRIIDEHPWLQFWLGTCCMFVVPDQSEAIFSGAYRQFQTRGSIYLP